MANGNGNGHRLPDIHGNATAEAAAVTTLVVFVLSLFQVNMDGETAAALTTLVAVGFGILRGSRYATNRRANDPTKAA